MVHLIISVPLPQIQEQIVDVPVPQVMEETVEAAKSIPQERVQRRTLEETVGVLVLLEVLAASRAVPGRGRMAAPPEGHSVLRRACAGTSWLQVRQMCIIFFQTRCTSVTALSRCSKHGSQTARRCLSPCHATSDSLTA